MESSWRNNLLLLSGVVLLTLVPLLMVSRKGDAEVFTGTDGQAEALITRMRPDYRPWFSSLWKPPSDEIENLLFALQAALGAGFLGYYFGLRRGQATRPGPGESHASD